MELNVVRRISIEAQTKGVDQAAASLNKLAEAQGGVAVASDKQEKASLSVERALERQAKSLDVAYRQTQLYEKAQRTLDQALQQGIVSVQRHAELSLLNAEKHNQLTKAANDNTAATGLNAAQLAQLGHAAKAAFEQIAAGAPALRVLAQQGATTAQALSLGEGGIAGSLSSIGRGIVAILGPLGTVAAAFLAIEVAALAYFNLVKKEGPTAEELFKEHDRLLNVIKNSYDRVTDSASKWFEQSRNVTQLQLLQQQIDLQKQLTEQVGKTIQSTTQAADLGGTALFGMFGGKGALVVKDQFGPFEDAIIELQRTYKAGQPDVKAFNDEVARIALADPALQKAALQLITMTQEASKSANALQQIEAALKLINGGKLTAGDRNALGLPEPTAPVAPQISAYDQLIQRTKDRIDELKLEAQTAGQTADAVLKLKLQHDAERAAKKSGQEVNQQELDQLKDELALRTRLLAFAQVRADIKFRQDSTGLSSEDVQIAQYLRNIYPDVATALASVEAQQMRVINAQHMLADGFREVGKSMLTAFVTGKNVMDAMVQSLDNLANKLANSAFDNILSGLMTGNLAQAGIGALQAGGAALISAFTGDIKAKQELEKAKDAWAKMADQVAAFNRAAAGVDLGPLTNQLMQLKSSYDQLALAALKAKDYQAIASLQATFNQGVTRTVVAFEQATGVSNDLQQQLKAVSDEGTGLIDFLKSLGPVLQRDVDAITDSIARQQQAIRDNFERGLVADIRNNSGVGYLNTIADAIRKVSEASAAGVNPNVLQAWLISTAQTAVNSAKLTGDAFNDMIAQFPQLTGVVHAFVDAAAEASQKLDLQMRLLSATTDTSTLGGALSIFDFKAKMERDAALAAGISASNLALLDQAQAAERYNIQKDFAQKAIDEEKRLADARLGQMQRIQEYLDNLTGGSGSTLSPGDRLSAASSQYATQLTAARGGDATALGNITSYSQNVLEAARAYYGSTSGYQSIFAKVQQDLQGLIALTGASAGAGVTSSALSSSIAGVTPIASAPEAANTNSWADLKASMESMKTEIITLRTALKEAIDKNSQIVAAAHTEDHETLEEIADTLSTGFNGNAALAAPRA